MRTSILYLLFFLLSVITLIECESHTESAVKSEGEIHYKISYLENDLEKISTEMLPKKMITKFKGDNYSFDIEGFYGLFCIQNIVNPRLSQNFTLLNIINKKFFYKGKINEPAIGFDMIPEMDIQYTSDTKSICGLTCKKAIITFPGMENQDTLAVFYTNEIPIPNPNRTTPYHDIDGVLMEFYLQLPSLKMKLTANAVYNKKIAASGFVKSSGYKEVSRAYLETVLYKLMEPE